VCTARSSSSLTLFNLLYSTLHIHATFALKIEVSCSYLLCAALHWLAFSAFGRAGPFFHCPSFLLLIFHMDTEKRREEREELNGMERFAWTGIDCLFPHESMA